MVSMKPVGVRNKNAASLSTAAVTFDRRPSSPDVRIGDESICIKRLCERFGEEKLSFPLEKGENN